LAVAPNGILFAAGWANDNDADYTEHALVMASADGGNTWTAPLDDFTGGPGNSAAYYAVASDPVGNLYAAGTYFDDLAVGSDHWFVRCSTDGGATWSLVDDYVTGGFETQGNGVAADSAGNVYVAGCADGDLWVVRKGIAGSSFATVDVNDSNPPKSESAMAVFVHPTAGVFAVGQGLVSTTKDKWGHTIYTDGWLVRRSTDGGATWSSVDKFALTTGYGAEARGIGADAAGNLYVVGDAISASGSGGNQTLYSHWIVRKSTDGGNSWATVDDALVESFPGWAGPPSVASAFGADANGNLFVAGWSGGNWIVRENPGGTGTWQTVDQFQYVTGLWSPAEAIATDASGHVFVGGIGTDSAGVNHWLVRKH
jgi:hypothetical protein